MENLDYSNMKGRRHLFGFLICFLTFSVASVAQEEEVLYYEDGDIKAKGILINGIKSGLWIF